MIQIKREQRCTRQECKCDDIIAGRGGNTRVSAGVLLLDTDGTEQECKWMCACLFTGLADWLSQPLLAGKVGS